MKQILIASTSTLHDQNYLEYLLPEVSLFFQHTEEILFIPYARPGGISHEAYTQKVQLAFSEIGKTVKGLHQFEDPLTAIENAKGIFTGGGNTFLLVKNLYENDIMTPLRKVILNGTPYLGTSAGSNICGLTMQTTNDMPIVYPPSFKTLGVIPFNINPHYLDPIPNSNHMGETRETRIQEFHTQNKVPVVGLREGSWLAVRGSQVILNGKLPARVFEYNKPPFELESGSKIEYL